VLSGGLSRHVFAVRHPTAAALGAALRPSVGRRLRHLHRGRDRRHARHHLPPHPDDRRARPHAHAPRAPICRSVGADCARAPFARRAGAALVVIALAALAVPAARADNLIDEGVRVAMLERADGRLAHIETPYNDVFITKRQHQLVMSFQLKGWDYTESVSNLLDPDDLPLRYAQVMTIAAVYP